MEAQQIIQAVIDRRKELRVTQVELAARTGIARRTIVEFESGNLSLSFRRLLKILLTLDMTLMVKPGGARPRESELAEFFKDDSYEE